MSKQAAKIEFKRPEGSADTNLVFVRANQMTVGQLVQGEYIGTLKSRFDEEKLDYKLEEVDDTGAKTGKTIIINGAGNLGYRMSDISLGALVQIQYLGLKKITKGKMMGKDSHSFDVLTA